MCGSSQTGSAWARQALRAVWRSSSEEGAAVAAAASGDRGHAGQRAGAGAAGEPEQHGLGLVVAGVAEQHGGGAVALGGGVQRGVAGVAGGGLGAALRGPTVTATASTGSRPQGAQPHGDLGGAARSEPAWRPWSMVTPPARTPSLGASKARAEASAMESAPPLQAASTSGRGGRRAGGPGARDVGCR